MSSASLGLSASSQLGPNPEDAAVELLIQTAEEEGEKKNTGSGSEPNCCPRDCDGCFNATGWHLLNWKNGFLCEKCVFLLIPN